MFVAAQRHPKFYMAYSFFPPYLESSKYVITYVYSILVLLKHKKPAQILYLKSNYHLIVNPVFSLEYNKNRNTEKKH